MRQIIYSLIAVLVFSPTAFDQSLSTTQSQQDDRVVVGTNLVTVNVIVTDRKGRYVRDVQQDQFSIYDNKVKQQIAHFSNDSPVSIGIVCQIRENTPEKTRVLLAGIKQFTTTLQTEDDFFFMAFSDHGYLTTTFIPSATQILDHLQYVKPGGPSSLYDSVYLAADRLKKSPNLKKALLVISDGQDTQSINSYKELRNHLRTFAAQVYAIGISDPHTDQLTTHRWWFFEDVTRDSGRRSLLMDSDVAIGRAVLAEMSRVSGGTTYFPQTETESELAAICTQIGLELRQQYTLAFYSNAMERNTWHRLKVNIGRTDVKLFYREGYQAMGN